MNLCLGSRFEKNPLVAWREMAASVVLAPVSARGSELKRLYRLKGPVACSIWRLVDGERNVEEVRAGLFSEFDGPPSRMERDLDKFLARLKGIGALREIMPRIDALSLSIGGMGFSIEWDKPAEVGWPHPFYEPFAGKAADPVRIRVLTRGIPQGPAGRLLFDFWPQWRLYARGTGYVFETFDPGDQSMNMRAFISRDLGSVEAHTAASPAAYSLPRLMNPLGQWLLACRLPSRGGLMLHALALDDNGRGRVFAGPSGSGKSTLAGFWRRRAGVRILGDERVIIRRLGAGFAAYGTPWPGLGCAAAPGPVPVEQVFYLRHARSHSVEKTPPGLPAGRLFSQAFLPRWNPQIVSAGLAVCAQLVTTFSGARLGFAKSPSVIDFVRNSSAGGKP